MSTTPKRKDTTSYPERQARKQTKRYLAMLREQNQAIGKELAGMIRSIARISTGHQITSQLLEAWEKHLK